MVDFLVSFIGGVWMYLYLYGTCRSYSIKRVPLIKLVAYLLMGTLITPFKLAVEICAVVWGLATPKHTFFVVQKDVALQTEVV